MAANLTSVVMQFLTPEVIDQIAAVLGLDKAATQKATRGAIPTLLAGLSDLVATPAGTNQLSRLLTQQAYSPADLVGKAGSQQLAETGLSTLSGLFGDRTLDSIVQAVGKFSSISDGGGKLLLGALGPIMLGALGQQQRDAGLDANGLASLLRSQRDEFVAAIPSGLAEELGSKGLIDVSGQASAAASRTANAARDAARQWPYWLAALILLGGVGWYAIQRQGQQTVAGQSAATQPIAVTGTVGAPSAHLTVDGINLANQLNSSIAILKSALPGITDAASAQEVLPKIIQVTQQLNDISTRAAKLSPEGRSALIKLIVAVGPSIHQMCDNVLATPGVGAVAKPTIDDLQARLDALVRV